LSEIDKYFKRQTNVTLEKNELFRNVRLKELAWFNASECAGLRQLSIELAGFLSGCEVHWKATFLNS